jgi:hypothetical protein
MAALSLAPILTFGFSPQLALTDIKKKKTGVRKLMKKAKVSSSSFAAHPLPDAEEGSQEEDGAQLHDEGSACGTRAWL